MIRLKQTPSFTKWMLKLKDPRGKAAIAIRLSRLSDGNFGDVAPVGESVSELRIHTGPGYRVYFIRVGDTIIVLLCGGDKSTQERDIKSAKQLAVLWSEDDDEEEI